MKRHTLPSLFLLSALAAVAASGNTPLAAQQTGQAAPAERDRVPEELELRYKRMAEELAQEPPKRDFEVVPLPPQKTPLLRPDAKLLENKFVAHLVMLRQRTVGLGAFNINIDGGTALEILRVEPLSHQFKALVERCPANQRPEKAMIDFLTSDDCNRDIRHSFMFHGDSITLSFHVFAQTVEEAEKRARAIVALFDGGFSRPTQRHLLAAGEKLLQTARDGYLDLPKVNAAIRAQEERLAMPSEITSDILSQLKAQKVMLAIELAGLNARVKACDAMLADPKKLEISTLQSISDMKVKADIERVGNKEKLDQINAFIAEGDQREAARKEQIRHQVTRQSLRANIERSEGSATRWADSFQLYAPLQISSNQIGIGPIEWTSERTFSGRREPTPAGAPDR
jgi:hypothetical protein